MKNKLVGKLFTLLVSASLAFSAAGCSSPTTTGTANDLQVGAKVD